MSADPKATESKQNGGAKPRTNTRGKNNRGRGKPKGKAENSSTWVKKYDTAEKEEPWPRAQVVQTKNPVKREEKPTAQEKKNTKQEQQEVEKPKRKNRKPKRKKHQEEKEKTEPKSEKKIEPTSEKKAKPRRKQGNPARSDQQSTKRTQKDTKPKSKKSQYSEYISEEEVEKGVADGSIVIGALHVARYPYKAYVLQEESKDIAIKYRHRGLNRAIHGDIVAVRIIVPEAKKESESEEEESYDEELIVLASKGEETETEEEEEEEEKEPRRYGTVVRIMEMKRSEEILGGIQGNSFQPMRDNYPRMIVSAAQRKKYEGELVTVKVTGWPVRTYIPFCEILSSKGEIDNFDTQYATLKMKNNITHEETFDESLLEGLPLSGWTIPDEVIAARKDLRNELIFSIDPPTARDLDDALSCTRLPNGNFEVGVHIADVSYFVTEGSPLDLEARERGTTVYFVTENVPMLPRILCDELCSLQGHVDRLAFSVIWELTPEGKKVSEVFTKSVICSKGQYDYATAHEMILHPELFSNQDETSQACCTAVNNLHSIAQHLRTERYNNGSLSLDNAEIHFDFDEEENVIGVSPYERYDSHFLVEEFMLLANISVAEKLSSSMTEGSMLRWHPKPDARKLDEFKKQCQHLGLQIDCTDSKSLNESIQRVSEEYNGITMDAILYLASQPMQSALYCAKALDSHEGSYHHYALNFPLYTHFTSPIRRYPDLVVHRQLSAIISGEPQSMKYEMVSQIGNNCNQRKREADYASRDCRRLYLNQYLRTRRFIESGIVVELSKKSVTVLVPDYDIRSQFVLSDKEYKLQYMKASKELIVKWKEPNTAEKDLPTVTLKLLAIVDVELLHTTENFCQTIGLKLAKPGEREAVEESRHKSLSSSK